MTTPDWHLYAACAEGDVNLRWFFPDMPSGRPSAAVHARTNEAKAVCARCDVREECLADYGGLEMGLALTLSGDVRTAWHVEYDKHPSAILAHRYPGVPNYGDVCAGPDWRPPFDPTVRELRSEPRP